MTGIWLEDAATRLSAPPATLSPNDCGQAVATLPAQSGWSSTLERRLIGLTFGLLGVGALAVPLGYILAFAAGLDIVWVTGTKVAVMCLSLALLALAIGGYAAVRLWRTFRSGQRVDAVLAIPMILAVMGMLDAAIFMPAVESQRTYAPLVDLVRQELNAGRRMALAGEHERDLGALMFYLDSRFTVIALPRTAGGAGDARSAGETECADFLYGRPGPAGILVAERDIGHAQRLLAGKPFRIVQAVNGGHKSEEFRLFLSCEPGSPANIP